ncbi:MAG TPA: helix-turn-helix transcriptional regulator [Candidatus Limnocylindrales bacterium]
MDDPRVGSVIRAVRIRRGLRQIDVAVAAGVSQAVVSEIERGEFSHSTLMLLRRVAEAVGVSLRLAPRWRGAEIAKLLDERHAALVLQVVARLNALGWIVRPEHSFSVGRESESIDVLAWLPRARSLLVVEVKTAVVDLQDLLSTLDRKRRLAPTLARELGWRPLIVGTLIVLPEETQARNAIAKYGPIFGAAYPSRGRAVARWVRGPERELRGIWFLLNIGPGSAKRRPGGSMRVRPRRSRPDDAAARSNGPARRSVRVAVEPSEGSSPT